LGALPGRGTIGQFRLGGTIVVPASITIRPARPDDAAAIVALIRRLAAFEREPEAVCLDEETVRRDVFGPAPRFSVLLAEAAGAVVGIVTLLDTYSSWAGAPAMIIHDLYVDEAVRGREAGRGLLAHAARLARSRGCCRLDVNVLAWNEPAQRFYRSLGFAPLPDWLPYRLDADGLGRLAGE
jgi:GNAT superfamily N-acetyltransferase